MVWTYRGYLPSHTRDFALPFELARFTDDGRTDDEVRTPSSRHYLRWHIQVEHYIQIDKASMRRIFDYIHVYTIGQFKRWSNDTTVTVRSGS